MNFKALEYFTAVVQFGTFTAASTELNIAQPAISRQIQSLEEELGVQLLIRARKGVILTGAGRYLYERVVPLLVELRDAKRVLIQQSREKVSDLVIGLTAGEGLTVASTLISRWNETFPAARLRIVEGLAPLIVSGMNDGSISLGIAPEPLDFPGLWTAPLFREPLVLICGITTKSVQPVIQEDMLSRPDYVLRLPLIAPSAPNPLRVQIDRLAAQEGLQANIILELDSMSIIKDLVQRGVGYALTTRAYLTNELEHGTLRAIDLPTDTLSRSVSLFGLKSNAQFPRHGRVFKFIQSVVNDCIAEGSWPGARALRMDAN